MKRLFVIPAVVFGLCTAAQAMPGDSFIDGYYVANAHLKLKDSGTTLDESDDGDGAGVRAAVEIAPDTFLTGEYQSNQYDDSRFELDQYRIGVGFGQGAGNGGGLYGRLEYINADDGESDEGGGVGTLGFAFPMSPAFRLYAEIGYQVFDQLDGPEFLIGANLQLTPNLGVFADYRATRLNVEDTDAEIEYDDVRVGARFYF